MSFFRDIYNLMFRIALRFYSMSDDLAEWAWPFYHLARPMEVIGEAFHALGDAFTDVYHWSRDLRDDIEYLFDFIYGYVASIPQWLLDKLNQAYQMAQDALNLATEAWAWANSIAGVIGTTFSQIVAFIREHAEIVYQTVKNYITNVYETIYNYVTNVYETIYNYVTNVYETVSNYITNVYETINHVYNTYVTNVVGVTEDIVKTLIARALATVAAPINLINTWFDDIQNFFNDPLGSILTWLEGVAQTHEEKMRSIFDKAMDALWR